MIPITHLTSLRKRHLTNHFELRGLGLPVRDGSPCWWLVFDSADFPPELIGAEHLLPSYAVKQLAQLRADPKVGARRRARHIDVSTSFFPEMEHNGIPHGQSVSWLKQYKRQSATGRYSTEKGYLVVCVPHYDESYPVQIWESCRVSWCPRSTCLTLSIRLYGCVRPRKIEYAE